MVLFIIVTDLPREGVGALMVNLLMIGDYLFVLRFFFLATEREAGCLKPVAASMVDCI